MIKTNPACFFLLFHVATRSFYIACITHIIFLLDSTAYGIIAPQGQRWCYPGALEAETTQPNASCGH